MIRQQCPAWTFGHRKTAAKAGVTKNIAQPNPYQP
jgi:hypothetical protein